MNLFCTAFLYGRAGRFTAKNAGFRPRRAVDGDECLDDYRYIRSCVQKGEAPLAVGG